MTLEEIEKLFVKLPKLFHPKFKPVIAGSYAFCITPKKSYDILLNDHSFESYNAWRLDKAFQDAYDDIKSFPNNLRRNIMRIFLNTLKSAFKKEKRLFIKAKMPNGRFKTLRFNSIEELLVQIDMNDIE